MKLLRNKPIVYVLETTGISGGIKVVFQHANYLARQGYDVSIFALTGQPNWFQCDVPVTVFADYEMMKATLTRMDAIKIATWWKTASVVMDSCNPLRDGKGEPWYFVQDIETSYYPGIEPSAVQERRRVMETYKWAWNFMATSEWVVNELKKLTKRKVHKVTPGIDLNMFYPNKRLVMEHNVFWLARYDHLKGLDKHIEVLNKVYQNLVNMQQDRVRYTSVGHVRPATPEFDCNTHYVQPSNMEMVQLYQTNRVFLSLSRHEGFSLSPLEAMASGCVVVMSDADGNMEYAKNEQNCILVPNVDSKEYDPNKVATQVLRMLTREDAEPIRRRAFETAQQFTLEREGKELMQALKNPYEKA